MKQYRVMTKVSSFPDGRPLLHECDDLEEAQRECVEWAEYDDITVWVLDDCGETVYQVDGYAEATAILYPESEEEQEEDAE